MFPLGTMSDGQRKSVNTSSLPSWACRIAWCDPGGLFRKQVLQSNLSNDLQIYTIAVNSMYDFSLLSFPIWMQIAQLEDYNLLIDWVANGHAAMSTLAGIPGISMSPPPGVADTQSTLLSYLGGARDQINTQIYQLVEEIYSLKP